MSFTAFLLAVLMVWLGCGIAAALALGRRGHDPYPWALLGAVLGPLVVPLALQARAAERSSAERVSSGVAGPGAVDVLVGIDGSEASMQALDAAIRIVGSGLGRLELVRVLTFGALDVKATPADHGRHEETLGLLASAATHARLALGRDPDQSILTGDPSATIAAHATEQHFDLVVIGSRGSGASTALLGSVAVTLAGSCTTPVLIVTA